MRLLIICGWLAAGEYLASLVPEFASAWPLVLVAATLVALFGYGLEMRRWGPVFVLLIGAALYLSAEQNEMQRYREKPWMRGKDYENRRQKAERDGLTNAVKGDLLRRAGIGLEGDREMALLVRAILLGERRRLPRRTKRIFVESGTMHVFAISGLHVMAVADMLALCLGMLMFPRRFAGLFAIPILWGYVLMIGFTPSAVRAAIMATFLFVAPVAWRKTDGMRAWSLTFLIVHVVRPLMITDVGNVLSFAVMLAIVVAGECAKSTARWRRTLLTTLAAWAAGVPIVAHVFGCVTPGGLIANLILISTAKVAVMSGTLGLVASFISERLAAHVNNLSALGIKAMVLIAEVVSRLPGSNIETGSWPICTCIEWYVALSLALVLVRGALCRSKRL